MQNYIFKRILLIIPNVLLVSFVITVLMRLIPGSTVDAMLAGAGADVDLDRKKLEMKLGLDVSLPHYWARWVGIAKDTNGNYDGLLQGNLGTSIWQKEPVTKLLSKYWPVTLEIGILGLIMAQLIALPIGIISALRQDTWGDYLARSFAIF